MYRHLEGRQALIDEVSIMRWSRMAELARTETPAGPVDHVLDILETFTRMPRRAARAGGVDAAVATGTVSGTRCRWGAHVRHCE
jgi:hypothetical protein